MSEFQTKWAGKRVELLVAEAERGPAKGALGYVVAEHTWTTNLLVEFDVPFVGGHDGFTPEHRKVGGREAAHGRGWFVPVKDLRLVVEAETKSAQERLISTWLRERVQLTVAMGVGPKELEAGTVVGVNSVGELLVDFDVPFPLGHAGAFTMNVLVAGKPSRAGHGYWIKPAHLICLGLKVPEVAPMPAPAPTVEPAKELDPLAVWLNKRVRVKKNDEFVTGIVVGYESPSASDLFVELDLPATGHSGTPSATCIGRTHSPERRGWWFLPSQLEVFAAPVTVPGDKAKKVVGYKQEPVVFTSIGSPKATSGPGVYAANYKNPETGHGIAKKSLGPWDRGPGMLKVDARFLAPNFDEMAENLCEDAG